MTAPEQHRKYQDGRDEMNLADFPISALQRQQAVAADGQKLDRIEFESSRYDPVKRQRVRQKVTLTSSARDGLPTPADEHVILALLYVAKHTHNFADSTVHFAPAQLFDIMGWAPNGRSYTRLRDVLRRLKALTIRYENAWWDVVGRGYEEEVATGILSAYRLARQVSGPRTAGTALQSWITWTQQFQQSLANGNIKRLNLEVFFQLRAPTAQRMYRFLDKRFYSVSELSLDLFEFACGHIGLTEVDNVAVLKRRLAPGLAELEAIGFLSPLPAEERFQKVKAGHWRIVLRPLKADASPGIDTAEAASPATPEPSEAERLVGEFYRQWDPTRSLQPGPRDLEQAQMLLSQHDRATAAALIGCLVRVTRKDWPDCRSLSGAVQKYLGDAVKLHQSMQQREARKREGEERRRQSRQEQQSQNEEERRLNEQWNALPAEEQQAIRDRVLARLPGAAPEAFIRRLCIEEIRTRE
jgi:plasmid replication initiation protein